MILQRQNPIIDQDLAKHFGFTDNAQAGRRQTAGKKRCEVRGKPWGSEEIEKAGFRLEFIPHLMQGRRNVAKGGKND